MEQIILYFVIGSCFFVAGVFITAFISGMVQILRANNPFTTIGFAFPMAMCVILASLFICFAIELFSK